MEYVHLEEPCLQCPASHECWNYCKEPDPANPDGPFRIVSWFECPKHPKEVT